MVKKIFVAHMPKFMLASLAGIASVLAATVLQFAKRSLIDSAIARDAPKALSCAVAFLALILGETLCHYLYTRFSSAFVTATQTDMRAEMIASALSRDVPSFGERTQGETIAEFSNGISQIADRHFDIIPELVYVLARVVLIGVAFVILNWKTALLAALFLTMPLYLPKLIAKTLTATQKEVTDAYGQMLSRLVDWFSGFETIKNFSLEGHVIRRFAESNSRHSDALAARNAANNIAGLMTMLMSYGAYFAIFAYSAWLVLAGEMGVGEFTIAYGMVDQLSYPIISLARYIRHLVAIRPTIASYDSYLASGTGQGKGYGGGLEVGIEVSSIDFSHEKGTRVFTGFSASFAKGGKYLITGASGAGKTTLSNLILRYYTPQSGDISIDGTSILPYGDIYSLAAVVRQDPVLFADSLRNNLALYREGTSDQDIIGMLEKVNLSQYANVASLDLPVHERATNFSGGERKRLSVARALLAGKELLIFDEPLANLDSDNAKAIASLIMAIEGKTVLVISHSFPEEFMAGLSGVVNVESANG